MIRLQTVSLRSLAISYFLLTVVIFLVGCRRAPTSKPAPRAVTADIVAAADRITGRKSEVTVRRASRPALSSVEGVYVSVSDPSQELTLRRAFADIARRYKLSIVETSSGSVDRFDLAFQGTRTHTIRVVTPLAIRLRPTPPQGGANARLAIIIDDLGNDRSASEAVVSLPFPVTIAVLPHLSFSAEIAEEAHRRGDQVLLHLPMQAESAAVEPEQAELRVGMSAEQVRSALAEMLDTVPHAVGVNNHEGSRATSDPALMAALMPALRERGLFFIDSRTTSATVAYDAAERSGVAAASRKVFLDDTQSQEAIREQIRLAASDALRGGAAIAIGHPHPATLAALAESVPMLESRGIRLVFASALVH
jgi:polysaccharide deacetylase 2 family uncharacterized protein YibQ